ncbi:flagellar motor switch protein FliM [Alphaproteobacteria bacterium]|jgi:flagellar motor switch protein FliM|nr:flagellar motor switch protein FliM [Alphaproteobacteria bacterium]
MSIDDRDDDTEQVLNKDEIDSLLGLEDGDTGETAQGLEALVSSSSITYERLPMLEVVFDRLVRMMTTSLRNFTSDNVEVSLENISSTRFGDFVNSVPLPTMLSVVIAEEWDNYILGVVDSALAYSVVDVLMGGRRGTAAMRIEGRPFTTIERNLVERMINVVLSDLSVAFEPISPITFRFDSLEVNPRFATIARPGDAAILAELRIDMDDRGGRFDLLFPYATLEPVLELLTQMFMGEKFGQDAVWENHLANEVWLTEIELDAVLDQLVISLNEVLNWKPGSRLMLDVKPDTPVEMRCGEVRLFSGKMGQRNGNMAVAIDRRLRNL